MKGFHCSNMESLNKADMNRKQRLILVLHNLTGRMIFGLVVGCWYCSTVSRESRAT